MREQVAFVGANPIEPARLDVLDRGAESDGAGDIRRARFELVRQHVVERPFEAHRSDHVAAALIRRHGSEQGGLPIEHADAGRAEQLVA